MGLRVKTGWKFFDDLFNGNAGAHVREDLGLKSMF